MPLTLLRIAWLQTRLILAYAVERHMDLEHAAMVWVRERAGMFRDGHNINRKG